MGKLRTPTGTFANGVFIPADPNSVHPRCGVPKRLTSPAIHSGMASKTRDAGNALAFKGGKRPLDDEPLDKLHFGKGNAPIHDGMGSMTSEHRGVDWGADHGSKVMNDAGNGSWRSEVASKHGVARLKSAMDR